MTGLPRSKPSGNEGRRTKREVNYEETDQDDSQLFSEALLSAAASGHKVRNIREKIEDIGENSQLGGTAALQESYFNLSSWFQ